MLWSGCTTNHDQLAKQPDMESTGTGGSTTGVTQASASATTAQSTATTGSGGSFSYAPDGDDRLTLVHGQVDAEHIAFCFGRQRNGRHDFGGAPLVPEQGLDYGEHVTLTEPGGLSLEDDDIVPLVLAGDLDAVRDLDCEAALAEAHWVGRTELGAGGQGGAAGAGGAAEEPEVPPLRAFELPLLPAGTLDLGRHYVLVVTGCMGGPGIVDNGVHCGPTFSERTPSLWPLLVPVSRQVVDGRIALQFLNASAATDSTDFRSSPAPGTTGLILILGFDVGYGVLMPQTPLLDHSVSDMGIPDGATVDMYRANVRELQVPWERAAGGEVPEDGKSYLAVLLGPSLGTSSAPGFNDSHVSVIETDSGRDE